MIERTRRRRLIRNALPATRDLPMFPVEVRDGEIWVAVPSPDEIEMPPE